MMEQYIDDFWDERNWQLALKMDNPVEAYQKSVAERRSIAQAAQVDELPPEQQSWLRAVQ